MIPLNLASDIDELVQRAHCQWLQAACAVMGAASESIDAEALIATLPPTNNAGAAHALASIIRRSEGTLAWRGLSASIQVCSFSFARWKREQHVELLWTGPAPASQIPARRIDQVLYDLIAAAGKDILLVTFAAYKISRLTDGLAAAINRGVKVRLVLEFEEASLGQLSMDALNAFPSILKEKAKIYYWPLEKREKNVFGNPGKLHAKAAVIDEQVVLSSANLTEDAFSRNLELGLLLSNSEIVERIKAHFESLRSGGTLKRWKC